MAAAADLAATPTPVRVHCYQGTLGLDLDLAKALALITKADQVQWSDHWGGHELELIIEGRGPCRLNVQRPTTPAVTAAGPPLAVALDQAAQAVRDVVLADNAQRPDPHVVSHPTWDACTEDVRVVYRNMVLAAAAPVLTALALQLVDAGHTEAAQLLSDAVRRDLDAPSRWDTIAPALLGMPRTDGRTPE